MNLKLCGVVLATLLVTGCATRPYNRIDADARSEIKSVDSVLIVTQSEIGSSINVSNISGATGGGLIPALIDAGVNSSRTEKAEEAIGPIRDKLIDYDFGAVFEDRLEAKFADQSVDAVKDVELLRSDDPKAREERVNSTSADAVMFITTDYKIGPEFNSVTATANVQIFPSKDSLTPFMEKPDDNPRLKATDNIYRNSFVASVPLSFTGTAEENAVEFSKLDMEEMTGYLDVLADNLVEKIVKDYLIDDVEEE